MKKIIKVIIPILAFLQLLLNILSVQKLNPFMLENYNRKKLYAMFVNCKEIKLNQFEIIKKLNYSKILLLPINLIPPIIYLKLGINYKSIELLSAGTVTLILPLIIFSTQCKEIEKTKIKILDELSHFLKTLIQRNIIEHYRDSVYQRDDYLYYTITEGETKKMFYVIFHDSATYEISENINRVNIINLEQLNKIKAKEDLIKILKNENIETNLEKLKSKIKKGTKQNEINNI